MNETEAAQLARILYNTGILKVLIIFVFGQTGIYLITEFFKNMAFKRRREEDHEAVEKSICLFSSERNLDVRDIKESLIKIVTLMERNGHQKKGEEVR